MRDASPIGQTSIAWEHSVNRSVRVGVIPSGTGEDHGPFGLNARTRSSVGVSFAVAGRCEQDDQLSHERFLIAVIAGLFSSAVVQHNGGSRTE